MAFRFYIFGGDGPLRLPDVEALEARAFPQYAGTVQKFAQVQYDLRGVELSPDVRTGLIAFDKQGLWEISASAQGGMAGLEFHDAKQKAASVAVPSLQTVREAKALADVHRWQPSDEDRRRITLDLLPSDDPGHVAIPMLRTSKHP